MSFLEVLLRVDPDAAAAARAFSLGWSSPPTPQHMEGVNLAPTMPPYWRGGTPHGVHETHENVWISQGSLAEIVDLVRWDGIHEIAKSLNEAYSARP